MNADAVWYWQSSVTQQNRAGLFPCFVIKKTIYHAFKINVINFMAVTNQ